MTKREIIKMQMKRIEKEIRDTPYHKGTEHHIGKLRARLSKLKAEDENQTQISKGSGGGGYAVKKQGDATVILIGPPSVGKSTLLNKLTNAKSKIAPYAFTTLTVIPGMMRHKDAHIQILDVPGIIAGAEKGRGRGREVLSVARGADLVIIMTDVKKTDYIEKIKVSLYENGIRLNMEPPQVVVEKKLRGNVVVHSNIKQDISLETIKDVAREFGYKNAEITIREKLTMDRLIDAFASNRVYVKAFSIVNKVDEATDKERMKIPSTALAISAEEDTGLEKLRDEMWNQLDFVRIYLVRRDEEPSFKNPMIVGRNQTLKSIASKISTDFDENMEQAKIWGNGAKFPGQIVPLTKQVEDGMQVRFV